MVLFSLPSVFLCEPAAELAVALHCLSSHQLPNLEATESSRSLRLDFSAIHQIQGCFEICLQMCQRSGVLGFCVICLYFVFS